MKFFNSISNILRKPFPIEENFSTLMKQIAAVSIFVVVVLFFIQPTEVSSSPFNKFLVCLGFGLVTFFISFIYEMAITRIFQLKSIQLEFTFGRWIFYAIGLILSIGLANFFYASGLTGVVNWNGLQGILKGTFVVGILPTIIAGGVVLLKKEKKYLSIATEINEQPEQSSAVVTEDEQEIFGIKISKIRYVEALQNYIKIGYRDDSGTILEKTERSTIKSFLQSINDESIVKCHRSYIVNRKAIISTSGNAQGLLLSIADCEKKIPVSRSFVQKFKK